MAANPQPQRIDLNTLLPIVSGVVVDLIGWIRRRHAESGQIPTDAEVTAHAKAKAKSIIVEGQQALDEFPDTEV